MNRILLVSPHWLGDALFTTAALRRIKQEFPQAECWVLAVPRVAEVFQGNPDVAHVLLHHVQYRLFWRSIGFIQELGKHDFDAVFLFQRSRTRAACAFFAGIPLRIGYASKGRGMFLTHPVKQTQGAMHRVASLHHLLDAVGIGGYAPYPVFFVREQIKAKMLQRFGDGRFALLHPGGNWPAKRWPADRFAGLADLLASRSGLRVMITGTSADKPLADEIIRKASSKPVSLAGQTNLEELGALMLASDIVVSNDSGPMHLAAALGTPLIALFGPTLPKITGPIGRGKIVILQNDIGLPVPHSDPDLRAMTAISVEEVFDAAQTILAAHSLSPL